MDMRSLSSRATCKQPAHLSAPWPKGQRTSRRERQNCTKARQREGREGSLSNRRGGGDLVDAVLGKGLVAGPFQPIQHRHLLPTHPPPPCNQHGCSALRSRTEPT